MPPSQKCSFELEALRKLIERNVNFNLKHFAKACKETNDVDECVSLVIDMTAGLGRKGQKELTRAEIEAHIRAHFGVRFTKDQETGIFEACKKAILDPVGCVKGAGQKLLDLVKADDAPVARQPYVAEAWDAPDDKCTGDLAKCKVELKDALASLALAKQLIEEKDQKLQTYADLSLKSQKAIQEVRASIDGVKTWATSIKEESQKCHDDLADALGAGAEKDVIIANLTESLRKCEDASVRLGRELADCNGGLKDLADAVGVDGPEFHFDDEE